jgi:hypothetical protein
MEQYKAEKVAYLIFHNENSALVPIDFEKLQPQKKQKKGLSGVMNGAFQNMNGDF